MHQNSDKIPISIDKIPCPFHYEAFFKSIINCEDEYWSSFQDHQLVRPGDLLVYLPRNYTPREISEISVERTGMHIMVIEKVLKIEADQAELTIVDCTRSRHCEEDTRKENGIGRAPLTIRIEKSGTTLLWGSNKKALEKNIIFGRLRDYPKKSIRDHLQS